MPLSQTASRSDGPSHDHQLVTVALPGSVLLSHGQCRGLGLRELDLKQLCRNCRVAPGPGQARTRRQLSSESRPGRLLPSASTSAAALLQF